MSTEGWWILSTGADEIHDRGHDSETGSADDGGSGSGVGCVPASP